MKKSLLFSVLTIGLVFTLNAQNATSWKIDNAHSSVNFSISHFFSTVTGRFTKLEGTFNFDPANLKKSNASMTIPVSSISTNDSKRDEHLQSGDFFDATTYPAITFTSTRFEKKSDKDYIVYGKLTIRNTTKDIALPFKVLGQMEHPMMKGTLILGLSAATKIKRNDYGVGTGSWTATMVVGDDVDVTINMELNRMK